VLEQLDAFRVKYVVLSLHHILYRDLGENESFFEMLGEFGRHEACVEGGDDGRLTIICFGESYAHT
jgi:hypothetical protein